MHQSFLVSSGSNKDSKANNTSWCGCLDEQTKEDKHLRKILYVRLLLIGSLLAAAAAVSTLSNVVLSDSERTRFTTQYNSISDSALKSVIDSFSRTNIGLREMASTYSYNYPNASQFPNVAWLGFQNTASLLGSISAVGNVGFIPIVKPADLPSYESYMRIYLLSDPAITMPTPNPGLELGQVWSLENFLPTHDTSGVSNTGSPYTYLAPIAQFTYSDMIGAQFYGYNIRDVRLFGTVLDQIIACTESEEVLDKVNKCGAISESVKLPFTTYFDPNPVVVDVQALLAHPIFPANNHSHIVGFIAGAVSWTSLLVEAVPTFVSGLDCVVSTDSQTFTYTIIDGVPVFRGVGDQHDTRFNEYRRGQILDPQDAQIATTAAYDVNFYPRNEFVQAYTTAVPIIAPIALVLVFLFCSAIFFAYDILMKREFGRKQAVLDTKRRFVRFISHEIRTPLNTVRLGLELLDGELTGVPALVKATPLEDLPALFLSTTEAWRHLADDISTNSASAVEVLDDLLNYDKIEMGNLRLELTMFNVWDLTRRTTSIMQMQAQQKNIVLELTCDGVLFTSFADMAPPSEKTGEKHSSCVIGDVARMGQVLRNLISNALKFTPPGGYVSVTAVTVENGMPDVHLPAQKAYSAINPADEVREGSIQISVKDSGAGLTEKQLLEICNEGVQFNANELQAGQGSGLGLFISKGIVEQHGGTLSVASEGLGKGVTFTIELPLYQASDSQSLMSTASAYPSRKIRGVDKISKAPPALESVSISADSSRTSSGIRRLVVVDDSHFNRKMLVRLLTSRGFVCEQAENGEEAIKVYHDMCGRAEPVDAILMDFEMPVMNGPTATKKLRELGCSCLIVGVTGNVLPEDVNYFKAQGANAVLVKPLVVDAFEALLGKHLFEAHRSASDDHTTAITPTVRPKQAPAAVLPLSGARSGQVHPAEEV